MKNIDTIINELNKIESLQEFKDYIDNIQVNEDYPFNSEYLEYHENDKYTIELAREYIIDTLKKLCK